MTLSELLSMPKGMSIEEYEQLLNEEKKLMKQISTLSDKILAEEDSLDVLSDEAGSDRYNKHLNTKTKLEEKKIKVFNQLDIVEKKLGKPVIARLEFK